MSGEHVGGCNPACGVGGHFLLARHTFEARYPGRCGVCDERIRPGDIATYIEDEIAHANCPTPVALAEPCPKCFMVPAVNGACGCDA